MAFWSSVNHGARLCTHECFVQTPQTTTNRAQEMGLRNWGKFRGGKWNWQHLWTADRSWCALIVDAKVVVGRIRSSGAELGTKATYECFVVSLLFSPRVQATEPSEPTLP